MGEQTASPVPDSNSEEHNSRRENDPTDQKEAPEILDETQPDARAVSPDIQWRHIDSWEPDDCYYAREEIQRALTGVKAQADRAERAISKLQADLLHKTRLCAENEGNLLATTTINTESMEKLQRKHEELTASLRLHTAQVDSLIQHIGAPNRQMYANEASMMLTVNQKIEELMGSIRALQHNTIEVLQGHRGQLEVLTRDVRTDKQWLSKLDASKRKLEWDFLLSSQKVDKLQKKSPAVEKRVEKLEGSVKSLAAKTAKSTTTVGTSARTCKDCAWTSQCGRGKTLNKEKSPEQVSSSSTLWGSNTPVDLSTNWRANGNLQQGSGRRSSRRISNAAPSILRTALEPPAPPSSPASPSNPAQPPEELAPGNQLGNPGLPAEPSAEGNSGESSGENLASNSNVRGPGGVIMRNPSLLALLTHMIILGLTVTGATGATPFERSSESVVWNRDYKPVATGFRDINMVLTLVSPCALLPKTGQDHLERAVTRCEALYNSLFLDELELMCPRKHFTPTHGRTKRFIPAVAVVGLIATVGVTMGIISLAENSYNRDDIEAIMNKQTSIVETLARMEEQVTKESANIQKLRLDLIKTIKNMEEMTEGIKAYKSETVDLSFLIAHLTGRLMLGQSIIRETRRQWNRDQMTTQLLDYLNITMSCGKNCPLDLGQPKTCIMSLNRDKIFLETMVPTINPKLIAVEADPFVLMTQKESKICSVDYAGPTNAIMSAEENCLYAIDMAMPLHKNVIISPTNMCDTGIQMEKTGNHRIRECKESQEKSPEDFVQVKMSDGHYLVYCPQSNFTLEGGEPTVCPNDIFKVSLTATFQINGRKYEGGLLHLTAQEKDEPKLRWQMKVHLPTPVNWTEVKSELDKIEEVKPIDLSKLVANNYSYSSNELILYTSIGIGFAVIATGLLCCAGKKSRRNSLKNLVSRHRVKKGGSRKNAKEKSEESEEEGFVIVDETTTLSHDSTLTVSKTKKNDQRKVPVIRN